MVDAVHRIVALQAQAPASPYIALWNRIDGFDPVDLDAAFANHSLVKATMIRITLHAVDAVDYTTFHEAMLRNLRASRLNDRRFTSTGSSVADTDALIPHLVEFTSQPRTVSEVEEMLTERLGAPPGRVWWALRTFAPLMHAPSGGPWSFGPRGSFLAAPTEPIRVDPELALQRLLRRYLEGFGPASAEDFGQFALQRRPAAHGALNGIVDTLVTVEGPHGQVLFDVPDGPQPSGDTPAPPRLMAMWDSVLLAHVDRSRFIPPEYRQLVMRKNGDVLPTLLVDGYVSGVWRPVDHGIEALAFHPLTDEAWEGLETEARDLIAFLADREPAVYRRYGHWWPTLPAAEIRVLPE